MILLLKRLVFNNDDECTLGELYVNGEFFAHTLEDKYRGQKCEDKIDGRTAIPYGKYKVIVDMSFRFKKLMLHVLNVPCFEGIRIHGGNRAKDSLGCILIGEATNGIDEIHNCALKVTELIEMVKNSDTECFLEII